MNRLLRNAFVILLLTFSSQCVAGPVLPSLPPGTEYRLAFVTAGTRNATSRNIQDYHNFVTDQAVSQPILNELGTDWYAIAGTFSANNGRTNSRTQGGGVPIFLLDGNVLVNDYNDLWDGRIGQILNVDQNGDTIAPSKVWTGLRNNGTRGFSLGGRTATVGDAFQSGRPWVESSGRPTNTGTNLPLYAISGTLTATAVPEPSAFLCLGLVGLSFAGWRRMKDGLGRQ